MYRFCHSEEQRDEESVPPCHSEEQCDEESVPLILRILRLRICRCYAQNDKF